MKLKELNKIFQIKLKEIYSANEINSLFSILAQKYLNFSKKDILLNEEAEINETAEDKFLNALKKLKNHQPVQYITGETDFYGLKLKVNENVLIPRPETEELVDWIIQDTISNLMASGSEFSIRFLDIGTGSGCIAIALKKNLPEAEVYAMDISENALEMAKENSKSNRVEIIIFHEDIFNVQHSKYNIQFSIIVSNPPYVKISEKEIMQKNVLNYEPHSALFVHDENPLLYYEAIVKFAGIHLQKNGRLYFEINEKLGSDAMKLLVNSGFSEIVLKKDLSGKDRMLRAKKLW